MPLCSGMHTHNTLTSPLPQHAAVQWDAHTQYTHLTITTTYCCAVGCTYTIHSPHHYHNIPLCSRMHTHNTLTSPLPQHTTAMQNFCQYRPSMHATVWSRFNFHAVFWFEYYTWDWTVIARRWFEQICVSIGCCCSNCTFWVTWTLASTYFLNALPKRIAEGTKEKHTSLQLAHILLKCDKETLHF
jgi:hypothetical protein